MILATLNFLLNLAPIVAVLLAQAETLQANAPMLYTYGPLGVFCGWFMLRGEALIKEVRGYGHRIDGLRLALLAQAAASDTAGPGLRRMCEEEIARINAKGQK